MSFFFDGCEKSWFPNGAINLDTIYWTMVVNGKVGVTTRQRFEFWQEEEKWLRHVQVLCSLLTWRACLWAAGSGSQIRPAWWPTWRRRRRLKFRGDSSPEKPPPPPHSALSDTRPCMHRHSGKSHTLNTQHLTPNWIRATSLANTTAHAALGYLVEDERDQGLQRLRSDWVKRPCDNSTSVQPVHLVSPEQPLAHPASAARLTPSPSLTLPLSNRVISHGATENNPKIPPEIRFLKLTSKELSCLNLIWVFIVKKLFTSVLKKSSLHLFAETTS